MALRSRRSSCLAYLAWVLVFAFGIFIFGPLIQFLPYEPVTCDACFTRSYEFTLKPRTVCQTAKPIDALIMIFSRARNFLSREVLRRTWIANAHRNPDISIQHVFLLGFPSKRSQQKDIEKENDIHGDIVQQSFKDDYYNLTLKTLMGFDWSTTHCPQAGYIIKVDEDVYANITSAVSVIRRTPNATSNVMGRCLFHDQPFRNPFSRYYTSVSEYRFSEYPPFCAGPMYILQMDMARAILKVSPNVPFYKLEDIYIAMCLAAIQQYGVLQIDGLLQNLDLKSMACPDLTGIIAHHPVTHTWIEDTWTRCGFKNQDR